MCVRVHLDKVSTEASALPWRSTVVWELWGVEGRGKSLVSAAPNNLRGFLFAGAKFTERAVMGVPVRL